MFFTRQGLLIATITTSFAAFYVFYRTFPATLLEGTASFIHPQFPTNSSTTNFVPTNGDLLGSSGSTGRSGDTLHLASQQYVTTSSTDYNRVIVIPRVSNDNVSWVEELIPDENVIVYTADDQQSNRHPPKNKGNEAMIYLTYIIDHYHELPDIIIFMHAHRYAWHNSDLLGFDAAEMIKRLSNIRVSRLGYVNMRCSWVPGCPEWLHPHEQEELMGKQEQVWLARSWYELFPSDSLPVVLAQPCCAQFAVSKERVLSISIERFVFYRDWLIGTAYSNYVSGRLWEFVWQYLFTGREVYCPLEHICYCDGFGICFGGDGQYQEFMELRAQKSSYEAELKELQQKTSESIEGAGRNATSDDVEPGRDIYLRDRIDALAQEIKDRKQKALKGGGLSDDRNEDIVENSLARGL